jgi:hypothetical protein
MYGKQVRTACGSGWLNVIIWKFILEQQVAKLQPPAIADGSDPYIDSEFAIFCEMQKAMENLQG